MILKKDSLMKRDMDIIRLILLEIEKSVTTDRFINIKIPEYKPEQISDHVRLLCEADLIEAKKLCDGGFWLPVRLTWAGHEFLDAAKNETAWNITKNIIIKKGGGLTFEVIKTTLATVLKNLIT